MAESVHTCHKSTTLFILIASDEVAKKNERPSRENEPSAEVSTKSERRKPTDDDFFFLNVFPNFLRDWIHRNHRVENKCISGLFWRCASAKNCISYKM